MDVRNDADRSAHCQLTSNSLEVTKSSSRGTPASLIPSPTSSSFSVAQEKEWKCSLVSLMFPELHPSEICSTIKRFTARGVVRAQTRHAGRAENLPPMDAPRTTPRHRKPHLVNPKPQKGGFRMILLLTVTPRCIDVAVA